jgi:hypothetical protein
MLKDEEILSLCDNRVLSRTFRLKWSEVSNLVLFMYLVKCFMATVAFKQNIFSYTHVYIFSHVQP